MDFLALTNEDNSPKTSNSEPMVLRYADSLVGTKDDDKGLVREFSGNVSMSQGAINVFCDRAFQYITTNSAELIGNVLITQNDLKLNSPKIFYYGGNRNCRIF